MHARATWLHQLRKHYLSRIEQIRVPCLVQTHANYFWHQQCLYMDSHFLRTCINHMIRSTSMSSQVVATDEMTPTHEQPSNGDYKKGIKYLTDMMPNMPKLPSEYVLPLPASPLSVSHASIPVMDLSGLSGSTECRMLTIQAIASACTEWGFFRIVNHGIKISLMEEMLEAIEGFFNLSWEEKMKYASDDVMDPVRYGTSLNTSIKHALHWRDYFRHFGHPFHSSFHLWPNNPSNYRYVAKEYLEEVWKLQLKIASAISEGLGLDSDYIEKSLGEGFQILASNYYPPCPEPHRTLGLAAHSDHGGLTILMQNDVDGLQVKHEEEWVAVEYVPGTFVVNIGDYLEILSNGRYKSVVHRAVTNAQRARISVAVGHGPEQTATVAPASLLVDVKDDIKYRPVTYKDYIKLQQSSAIRGKSPLQTIMTHNSTNEASSAPLPRV
ncbi:protein DOWNY MILDEW RESISTANCE 6-like [Cornus florida]|uniref:protein DOWNY MILDEW RESISTANCE 6-like n=1 Tax=Cornus florida TaxID=4283 RepID=UPI00289D09F9|nr:protein DOWNY MILDEW RESISTANCE 6-like [Cornus florida]